MTTADNSESKLTRSQQKVVDRARLFGWIVANLECKFDEVSMTLQSPEGTRFVSLNRRGKATRNYWIPNP